MNFQFKGYILFECLDFMDASLQEFELLHQWTGQSDLKLVLNREAGGRTGRCQGRVFLYTIFAKDVWEEKKYSALRRPVNYSVRMFPIYAAAFKTNLPCPKITTYKSSIQLALMLGYEFKPIETINQYKWDKCRYTAASKENLRRHMNDHIKERCEQCPEWVEKVRMSRHLDKKHSKYYQNPADNAESNCPICNKVMISTRIRTHIQVVHDKWFACLSCDAVLPSIKQLTKHKTEKHPADWIKCPKSTCGFSAFKKETVVRHVKKMHFSEIDSLYRSCPAPKCQSKLLLGDDRTAHMKAKHPDFLNVKADYRKFKCPIPDCKVLVEHCTKK